MKRILNFLKRKKGSATPITLLATAFLALATILGITVIPTEKKSEAHMRIESAEKVIMIDKKFVVEIIVESPEPVNVFAGELHFNPDVLAIDSIDYNNSVADLWAELPWYSNGEGTLTFGGGTTQAGGFQGSAELIKVTFKTLKEGQGILSIMNPRMLRHDGLGTDLNLQESPDAIFTIGGDNNLIPEKEIDSEYSVAKELPSTDLNGDGKQSVADISIFMLNMAGNNSRYDFNLDGKVDTKDLNILLKAE